MSCGRFRCLDLAEQAVMDGLTALRHIREEENGGTLAMNLVIALS